MVSHSPAWECADYPSRVPPNVSFQIDDAESVWTWPENHFDFIHIRHMTGAIEDWPALIKQAYKWVIPVPSQMSDGVPITESGNTDT